MTPEALTDEFRAASRSLNPCPCGSPVVMAYEPGATYIHCLAESKTIAALPDWAPTELAQQHNLPRP